MLDALLCTTDPGDGVLVTDPTYAGIVNRVRLPCNPPNGALRVERGRGVEPDDWGSVRDGATRAVMVPNPGMPTGVVPRRGGLGSGLALCQERDLWLIYVAWMETILFDGAALVHPAGLPGNAGPGGDYRHGVDGAAHDRLADRLDGRARDTVG